MRSLGQNPFWRWATSRWRSIAAGVLYPALGMHIAPMVAAAAMSRSSESVISNSLGLRRVGI